MSCCDDEDDCVMLCCVCDDGVMLCCASDECGCVMSVDIHFLLNKQ